jgi:hypothetical protein
MLPGWLLASAAGVSALFLLSKDKDKNKKSRKKPLRQKHKK